MSAEKTVTEHSAIPCDLCGACCQTFPVLVSIGDAALEPRIQDEALRLKPWQRKEEWEYQLHPLPFNEGCCFLATEKLCSIYETRPAVCRKFAAGTPECSEARARVGLSPLSEGSER
jgi:Fe-S-cluster containining protein